MRIILAAIRRSQGLGSQLQDSARWDSEIVEREKRPCWEKALGEGNDHYDIPARLGITLICREQVDS